MRANEKYKNRKLITKNSEKEFLNKESKQKDSKVNSKNNQTKSFINNNINDSYSDNSNHHNIFNSNDNKLKDELLKNKNNSTVLTSPISNNTNINNQVDYLESISSHNVISSSKSNLSSHLIERELNINMEIIKQNIIDNHTNDNHTNTTKNNKKNTFGKVKKAIPKNENVSLEGCMYNMAHTSNLSELSNNSNSELVVNKIECNETMVNISSLNQGAVTQQNLGNLNKDSKDKFDMNAISIMSTEVHEKVEVQQHATPVSNDNEIHNYTHHVEKMNDDNINNETTEAEIEKRGIRIRSKDTSLSSKYAKEYASMCEEFCCFNYIPPLKSISHFVFHNDFSSLARLIENQLGTDGFDLNQRDETGETASWTPLYWSVKLNKIDFVKYLLEQGADVNIVINDYDECCGTALDLAMLRGYEVMEKILKEHMEKDSNNTAQKGFKNIRTKPRGKAPAFNFKYYGKKKRECQFSDSDESMGSPDYTLNK